MAPRPKVLTLPAEVRAELDARLVSSGFGGYESLSMWLADQGYEIGKSALHKYGRSLEQDFERTMADVQRTQTMAKAYAKANPDEANALTGATVRIAQEHLLRLTIALREAEDDPAQTARVMPQITRALADLGRLDISREKWGRELAAAAAAEARAADAAKLEAMAKADGQSARRSLDPETLRRIREEVYGIVERTAEVPA